MPQAEVVACWGGSPHRQIDHHAAYNTDKVYGPLTLLPRSHGKGQGLLRLRLGLQPQHRLWLRLLLERQTQLLWPLLLWLLQSWPLLLRLLRLLL